MLWPAEHRLRKGEGAISTARSPAPLSSLTAETKEHFYANQCTQNELFKKKFFLLLSLGSMINGRSWCSHIHGGAFVRVRAGSGELDRTGNLFYVEP